MNDNGGEKNRKQKERERKKSLGSKRHERHCLCSERVGERARGSDVGLCVCVTSVTTTGGGICFDRVGERTKEATTEVVCLRHERHWLVKGGSTSTVDSGCFTTWAFTGERSCLLVFAYLFAYLRGSACAYVLGNHLCKETHEEGTERRVYIFLPVPRRPHPQD